HVSTLILRLTPPARYHLWMAAALKPSGSLLLLILLLALVGLCTACSGRADQPPLSQPAVPASGLPQIQALPEPPLRAASDGPLSYRLLDSAPILSSGPDAQWEAGSLTLDSQDASSGP